MRSKDISEQRFGKLTAIRRVGKTNDGHIIWECNCDCGNVIQSPGTYLVRGNKKSCGCLIMDKRMDLSNQRFGRLVAIKDVGTIKNGMSNIRLWECLCDCGNLTTKRSSQLIQMKSNSCGCLVSDTVRARVKLPDGESGFNALFAHYVSSAKRRQISFELTKEHFVILTKSNCFYCGDIPKQECYAQKREGFTPYIHNGIDRYNNELGYTVDNSRSCCTLCNYFKHNLDVTNFLNHVEHIHSYQIMKQATKQ